MYATKMHIRFMCSVLDGSPGMMESFLIQKYGCDKGGKTFKMNFQIVNVPAPNSVRNTCVFKCFEAGDSITNLHSALDRHREQVTQLQRMKWRYTNENFKYYLTCNIYAGSTQYVYFCVVTMTSFLNCTVYLEPVVC